MVKIFNRFTLAEKSDKTDVVRMFKGNAAQNVASHEEAELIGNKMYVKHNGVYSGSVGEEKLMSEIEQLQKLDADHKLTVDETVKLNAAQNPGQTVIEALIGKTYIDITRRSQENGDLTSLIAREASDPNSDETVNVNYFYDYVGKMGTVEGTNDSVNLIEQKTGATDSFVQTIKAIGWKTSLSNLMFNKLHTVEKVNKAAANADTDVRNEAVVGTIVGATYVGSQQQAYSSTGSTVDVNTYLTLQAAIKKLRGLKDVQTSKKIAVPAITILCNSVDTWQLSRVIGGQLQGSNGTLGVSNMQGLPISNIIEYDQGITDGKIWGKETLDYPGVVAGTCYMFVPKEYLFVMNKRGLTLETGTGSVLQLSTEERAWYRVFGTWFKDFLGSSYPATALGASYGAIIEVKIA